MSKLKILSTYLQFRNRLFTSRKKLEAYQQRKLKKHLAFVTEKSAFYCKYKGHELKDFPIIDKGIMMENFDTINTVGIKKEEALEFAVNAERTREFGDKLKNITVGLSSGTSHSRGAFLVEKTETEKWAGFVLAKFLPHGILGKYKIAFFMRANSNLYQSVGSKNIRFEFYDIYADMDKNIEKLEKNGADILVAQPSALLMIAAALDEKKINIHPETVISIAEVLEKEDEERIKKSFGTDVIHQVYQCTEGCLATTCKYGTLHLNEDIVFIEKEYIDKNRFIPIITDFERTSQPIIRYRLNDVLVEKKEKCRCGSACTALEKIEGREDDVFIFHREEKEVKIFPDFIRRCILFSGNISDYRIVQQADGSISIYADIDDKMKEKVTGEFKKLAEDNGFKLPEIRFEKYAYDKNRKLKRVERVS